MAKMTGKQRSEVNALLMQAYAVRALQAFIIGLGAALGYFGGRGWPPFVIGLGLAAWMQTHLPVLPEWAEKMRKRKD